MKTKIDKLTMKLGLWLIGDRQTPGQVLLQQDYLNEVKQRQKYQDAVAHYRNELEFTQKELKEAKINIDNAYDQAAAAMIDRGETIKKYNSLKKRYDKLRLRKKDIIKADSTLSNLDLNSMLAEWDADRDAYRIPKTPRKKK